MALFFAALAVGLGIALTWHAILIAPAGLRLTVLDIPIVDLPVAFDGYRIAVLTDFHHGPQQPLQRARRAIAYANSQTPHLAVLLGDYGTSESSVDALSRKLYQQTFDNLGPALRALRARDGILAVLGNHDFYASATDTQEWLESLDIQVLRNTSIQIAIGVCALRVVGIDDLVSGGVSADTIQSLTHGEQPTIMLSHHPDAVQHCVAPSVRLVLSGHTHGGQVVLPIIGAPVTRSQLCTRQNPAGWIPNKYAPLFVSRGIGVQIPFRYRCPPEVVVLTLRPTAQQPV